MILEMEGFKPLNADNGQKGLELARKEKPDLILCDITMPAMDGYELAVRLRAQLGDGTCRLIALTGYGQEADRARSQQAGFEIHLVKPVDVARLTALVDAHAAPQIGA